MLNNFKKKFLSRTRQVSHGIKGPIIIYQMAKVGSRSVYETLANLGLNHPIYHRHVLHNLDLMEANINQQPGDHSATLKEIAEGKKLRALIDDNTSVNWNIITLVRDPIAQTISRFFQSIEYGEVAPDTKGRLQKNSFNAEELFPPFFQNWPHDNALIWFDHQFTPVFNIDIYSTPFPFNKGYNIIRIGRFSILVLRMESLNSCANRALSEFLDVPGISLLNKNLATDKWYKKIYREFCSKINLPEEYLDKMYSSKFAQHFYSSTEIESFRQRWQR